MIGQTGHRARSARPRDDSGRAFARAPDCRVPSASSPAVLAPPAALACFVEQIRVVEAGPGGDLEVAQLPDGRTTLVYRVLAGGETGDLWVAGPRTHAKFKHTTDVARAIVVQFKPGGAAPLLGLAASALTDRIVQIDDIWGRAGAELCREMLAAARLPDVIGRLTDALAARAVDILESASARLAREAVRLLEGGEARVERVAAQLGVTARHLRRVFVESVGIGPKEFARTVRLQRAVRTSATSHDWARIAADAGYYDQAHLIGDFRALVGLTPGAFARRAGQPGPVAHAR